MRAMRNLGLTRRLATTTAVIAGVLLGLTGIAAAEAPDLDYSRARRGSVSTHRAAETFVYGSAFLGWAFAFDSESFAFDNLPNQFFLDRATIGLYGRLDDKSYHYAMELQVLGNLDDSGVDGLTLSDNPDGTLGDVVLKYAFIHTESFPVQPMYIRFGLVNTPWVSWEEKMWGYRSLRRVAVNQWGYASETELGFTHHTVFNDEMVQLTYGVYNGAPGHYGLDGSEEKNSGVTDMFKMFAAQLLIVDGSGLGMSAAVMAQNQPGNDDIRNSDDAYRVAEDGYRILGGVFYDPEHYRNQSLPGQAPDLMLAVTAGLVLYHGRDDRLPGFISFMADIGASLFQGFRDWSIVARVDVHQLDFNDPTRSEAGTKKYYKADGTLIHPDIILPGQPGYDPAYNSQFLGGWEVAVTLALAIRLADHVRLMPTYRGDYSDATEDSTLFMVVLEYEY